MSDSEEMGGESPPRNLKDIEIQKYLRKKQTGRPIKADIYQMYALGWIRPKPGMTQDDVLRLLGQLMIPIVQVVGPFAILVWAIYHLDWSEVRITSPSHYEFGSMKHGVSRACTTALASIFLFLFPLYGIATVKEDAETLLKLKLLYHHMRPNNTPVKRGTWIWLDVVGPLINSWVILITLIDMVLLFFATDSPKDLLFDSLGLLFLFNLDDAPGQVDALFPDWPAEEVGEAYFRVMRRQWSSQESQSDDEGLSEWGPEKHPFKFECSDDNLSDKEHYCGNPDAIIDHIKDVENQYLRRGIGQNWTLTVTQWILTPLVIVMPVCYLSLCESIKPLED